MKMHYVRKGSARLFEAEWLEVLSKVHPATPFCLYFPIIATLLGYAFVARLTTLPMVLLFGAAGWITWSMLEYVIHRWLFHWEGNGPISRKFHDIIHGYHHQYPDDAQRLVMPLGASIPLAIVIGAGLWLLQRPGLTIPYFFGLVAGYLFYDFMHWSLHARTPRTAWGRALRAHHMAHHFAVNDKNFGISHRWIDFVVGTARSREERAADGQRERNEAS